MDSAMKEQKLPLTLILLLHIRVVIIHTSN